MPGSEKTRKRQTISIVVSLMIILLIAINIFRINYMENESKYTAKNGVLNLTDWNPESGEIIDLDGEWEFYSGKLIEPDENFDKEIKQYAKVPGDWKTYLKGQGLENGSGTYRLNIKVPKDMIYVIKAKTIRTSHIIYFNGEKIAQAGKPSIDEKIFKPESKYKLGVGSSLNGEIELIIHITSLDYRSGGIYKSIEIGSFESSLKKEKKDLVLDSLLVAICLTLSLYFFSMYLQRRKEHYLVYFSGVTFFMALYLATTNEQILSLVYNYNPTDRIKIQILAMILTSVCFLRFMHCFFERYKSKKIVNAITIFMLSLLAVFIIIINKGEIIWLTSIQIALITSIAIAYIYIFYILIKAIREKIYSIEYILVIFTTIASYWFIVSIKIFLEIDLGNTSFFIILLTLFSVAELISHRLQLDYHRVNQLSRKFERYDDLKDSFFEKTSLQLEESLEKMSKRTKDLLEGKDGMLNLSQQESLFKTYQETEKIRRISDGLIDLSLIKKGKIKLSSNPIDIYKSVEDVLEEIEVLIPYDDSIEIKNNIAKNFPKIKADSNKFRQIIYDLINNAIKYTKDGEITISAEIVKGHAEIKVEDTGLGIEEKYLKEVFNIFYQNNKDTEVEEGLGIGLYIVKKLVEIQGGKIYAESIYGKGTKFIFELPLYTEEDKRKNEIDIEKEFNSLETLDEKEKHKLKKEKILIIENKPINQKLLKDIVKELNYNMIAVNSGKRALEIIKKEKIDLVILDFMLPDMTSNRLCNQIRKEYSMGELPILILTASGRTIDLISSFNYGVNDFQRKPVDSEELKSRIQSLLLIKASAEEGLEKEFQYFYSQISPHFLYNTLNSIIGLSYKDSQKSREALNNLSVYLRGKLDIHRKQGFVSLESELELVTAYLEIEKLRYGKRLEVSYNVEEELKAKIPPLTLQPIVENSIKHGIASLNNGKIEITTKKEKDRFVSITIKDNGKGMTDGQVEELLKGNGEGIGFKNVMERIKILKGASLTLNSKVGEGTEIKIIIPEVKSNEDYEDDFN